MKRETGNLKLDAKPTQRELIGALKDAGYTLDGFSRKGVTLVVRLTPADDFQALDICEALGLQARCTVFAETGRSLLILSVRLPEQQGAGSGEQGVDSGEQGAKNPTPPAPRPTPSSEPEVTGD